jgi:hypothetical protein
LLAAHGKAPVVVDFLEFLAGLLQRFVCLSMAVEFLVDQGNLKQCNSHAPCALTGSEKFDSNFVKVNNLFKLDFCVVALGFVCF